MSSTKIPLNKIIIGTSSWGSKSSYKNSFAISKFLIEKGFNQFDSAPNYGSGYSHNILNIIGEKQKILVNTKFGQRMNFNLYEILKRIYRFNNFKSFINSTYNLYNSSKQNEKKYWQISNISKNYVRIKKHLNNCNIKVFYLHSPKSEIINENFLDEFEKFCFLNNLKPGIANIDDDSLKKILFNNKNYTIQMSLCQYIDFEKQIIESDNDIHINSIFKLKYEQDKFDKNKYIEAIIEYFKNFKKIKLVFGINSISRCNNLINNLKN